MELLEVSENWHGVIVLLPPETPWRPPDCASGRSSVLARALGLAFGVCFTGVRALSFPPSAARPAASCAVKGVISPAAPNSASDDGAPPDVMARRSFASTSSLRVRGKFSEKER